MNFQVILGPVAQYFASEAFKKGAAELGRKVLLSAVSSAASHIAVSAVASLLGAKKETPVRLGPLVPEKPKDDVDIDELLRQAKADVEKGVGVDPDSWGHNGPQSSAFYVDRSEVFDEG